MNIYEKLIVGFKDYEECPNCDGIIDFDYDYHDNYGNNFYKGKCNFCHKIFVLKPLIWGMKEYES